MALLNSVSPQFILIPLFSLYAFKPDCSEKLEGESQPDSELILIYFTINIKILMTCSRSQCDAKHCHTVTGTQVSWSLIGPQ